MIKIRSIFGTALIFTCLLATSCSTVRLRYQAEVQKSGKSAMFRFEKSYDISGGQPILCFTTAIFFGGACWYYLAMPTVNQTKKVEKDAIDYLIQQPDGLDYSIVRDQIDQTGWSEKPTQTKIDWE